MPLALKHRPSTLEEVVGNEATIASLRGALTRDPPVQSYLFTGPEGTGKTTCARICATTLGIAPCDFEEMNNANYSGVDASRSLLGRIGLYGLQGKRRGFLLDECHRMSPDSQDILLKALEEPPPHCFFFLATTEPQKLRKTLRSRCMDFKMDYLDRSTLVGLLSVVLAKEGASLQAAALDQIAEASLGSPRTALVMLESVLGLTDTGQIQQVLQKIVDEGQEAIALCRLLMRARDWGQVARVISELKGDPESVRRAVMGYACAILRKSDSLRAYDILVAFEKPTYDSGMPAIWKASYEVIKANQG